MKFGTELMTGLCTVYLHNFQVYYYYYYYHYHHHHHVSFLTLVYVLYDNGTFRSLQRFPRCMKKGGGGGTILVFSIPEKHNTRRISPKGIFGLSQTRIHATDQYNLFIPKGLGNN